MKPIRILGLVLCQIFAVQAHAQQVERAEVAWAGTYKVADTREVEDPNAPSGRRFYSTGAEPIRESTRVPVAVGTRLGAGFVLFGSSRGQSVPYQVVWRFPEAGLRNPEGRTIHEWRSPPYSCPIEQEWPCLAGYAFQNEWEVVSGVWKLEVWAMGQRLFERSFEVVKQPATQ